VKEFPFPIPISLFIRLRKERGRLVAAEDSFLVLDGSFLEILSEVFIGFLAHLDFIFDGSAFVD
jgi:hypothetical protein